MPDRQVVILDPDDGVSKLIAEIGLEDALTNLTVVRVTEDWQALIAKYRELKTTLNQGDFLCFDMINRFWDLSQEFYSLFVFGESPIEHLLALKKQVDKASFGGFDGLTDWNIIKRLHNEQLVDDAVVRSDFNVVATTGLRQILPVERAPTTGLESIYARQFRFYPEGEKHNIHRFDTQAYLYRKANNTYWFRIIRDRGRPMDMSQEFEITGSSYWAVYSQMRGLGV